MPLSAPVRKTLLSIHIGSSVGWLGAVLVFAAHAWVGFRTTDASLAGSAALAMQVAAWWVVLPLAVLALASGVAQAMASGWGLWRHYWVLIKLLLTLVATAVLLTKLGPIDQLASAYAFDAASSRMRISLLIHAIGGALVLCMVMVVGVFKPAGRRDSGERLPRWVKGFAAAALLIGVIVIMLLFTGDHGPRIHG